jgi:hypothetical protein
VPLSYYHCGECGTAPNPSEERLGLLARQLIQAAEQIVALACALTSFREASEWLLHTMAGLCVSESPVQRR